VEAGNSITLVYIVLLSVGKSVLKIAQNLWKNSHIIAKNIRTIHINFIVIEITFSGEKK
jgi:hypothetical protein